MILNVLLYSSLAGVATIAGIMLLRLNEDRALRYSHFLNSFAAGIILSVAFFHQLPESIEISSPEIALAFTAVGFVILYLLETVLVFHSGVEIHFHGTGEDDRKHARALVGFSGLLFHSLLDGVVIGIGFEIDEHLGFLTALGVILHEVPEGTTTYSILMGTFGKKAALWMSLSVAVATPVGAVLSLAAIPGMSESTIGGLLAVAAGSFLYVGASDLLPETHGRNGIQNAACVLGGGGLIYIIGRILHGGH